MVPGAPWRVLERDLVESTNDEARRLAEAGDPGRVAVRAREQRAGRGRRGRAWASGPGGLYLSALLRPSMPSGAAGILPLAAGLAVARTLEGLGASASLRWPNDVLLAGRKVAGVLCEARLEGPRLAWVVVGIGLNVAQPLEAVAGVGGITLREALGRRLAPEGLVPSLLAALDEAVAEAEGDPGRVAEAWARRAPMLGGPVQLLTDAGPLAGVAERVEPSGALLVRTPDGVRTVTDPDLVQVVKVHG